MTNEFIIHFVYNFEMLVLIVVTRTAPVEQSIPVRPLSHSQIPFGWHVPCPLQLLGQEPAVEKNEDYRKGYTQDPHYSFVNVPSYFLWEVSDISNLINAVSAIMFSDYKHEIFKQSSEMS